MFLRQAVESTGVTPQTATMDHAAIYPPALQVVLPDVEHLRDKIVQQWWSMMILARGWSRAC